MRRHQLKTVDWSYDAIKCGDKPFSIRYNDRGYQTGDHLTLVKMDGKTDRALGEHGEYIVTYVTSYEQKPGYVVLGIKPRLES